MSDVLAGSMAIGGLAGLTVAALAYVITVIYYLIKNPRSKFGDLLTPQFKELIAVGMAAEPVAKVDDLWLWPKSMGVRLPDDVLSPLFKMRLSAMMDYIVRTISKDCGIHYSVGVTLEKFGPGPLNNDGLRDCYTLRMKLNRIKEPT